MQVGTAVRTDCVLAETFLRLDHLETALHNVKHEEVINGLMMRLDHMAVEMQHLEDGTSDRIEEARKQQDFKDAVRSHLCARLPESRGARATPHPPRVCCRMRGTSTASSVS